MILLIVNCITVIWLYQIQFLTINTYVQVLPIFAVHFTMPYLNSCQLVQGQEKILSLSSTGINMSLIQFSQCSRQDYIQFLPIYMRAFMRFLWGLDVPGYRWQSRLICTWDVRVRVCIHICMCLCVYVYIYIYIKKPLEDVREKQHQYHIV